MTAPPIRAVGARCLVVDDDAQVRGALARVIDTQGLACAEAASGAEALALLRLGGELHDIGKIGTREAILNKPGPLTPEEFEHIKAHSILAERILTPSMSKSPSVLRIAAVVDRSTR